MRGRGELALLTEIRERAAHAASRSQIGGLRLGIGDDCALVAPRRGEELAITTDLSIAGRHFRLDWHQPEAVGHRALARGLSDLAAMGARPVAAFLSLGLPRSLTLASGRRQGGLRPGSSSWVERFFDGFLALAEAHSTPLAGGDLAESPLAVADIVLVGAVPRGRALLRSGAKPGDLLYVTGTLGGAAAGLVRLAELAGRAAESALPLKGTGSSVKDTNSSSKGRSPGLKRMSFSLKGTGFSPYINAMEQLGTLASEGKSTGNSPANASCCGAEARPGRPNPPRIPKKLEAELAPHLYPQPRVRQGLWLQRHGLASAALDVSDGLSPDLAHLCQESGVAAEVDAALVPTHPAATLDQALHGGEDYELVFTAPASARLPRSIAGVKITRIGRIVKLRRGQPALTLLTSQGPQPLEPHGWEHFSSARI